MSGTKFGTALRCVLMLLVTSCSQQSQWNEAELAVIQSMSLASLQPATLPQSNRVAANATAAAFGRALFHDTGLSASGKLSCASCHQADRLFTDGLPRGRGAGELARNTPTLAGLAWHHWFYWDGRKDSLWSQALAPIEAGVEMNSSRLMVARHVTSNANYRRLYEQLFGAIPKGLPDALPELHASPYGSSERQNNWQRLPQYYRQQVNQVFADTGKAIAAYVRTLEFKPSRFDRYASLLDQGKNREADRLLSDRERAGLAIFISDRKSQCMRCHNGPLLTNFDFHNIGSGNLDGDALDFGRMLGLQAVMLDEFNCLGPYSDAPANACEQLRFANRQIDESMQGAYKTPSLRGLSHTAPYFHDGRYQSLTEVLEHYVDTKNTSLENRLSELNPIELDARELNSLEAFLLTLSAP